MNKKVILFDIDYTLFNTDKFRDTTYPKLLAILKQEESTIYKEKVKEVEKELIARGGYEPVTFAHLLAEVLQLSPNQNEVERLFYDTHLYDECLYPEVKHVLQVLSEKQDMVLGIVSRGEDSFQRRKIESVSHYFPQENIFISLKKVDMIGNILNRFPQGLSIIDDSAPFLSAVQKANGDVFSILVERENRYERKEVAEDFVPDLVITSLDEFIPLLSSR